MPMNPNFLCCIGAELKNSTQQTTRMTQVYLYRAFEDDTLSDMLSAGFFDEAIGVLRKDDLLLLYSPNETVAKWTYARVSNVDRDGVTVAQISIDATTISVNTTGYSNLSGNNLQQIMNNLDTLLTTMNDAFVKKDGTSIMSAPLKFVAGSLRGGIGPSFGGVEFYTLNNDSPTYSLVALGRFTTSGFIPHVDNTYDIGSTARKWKDLYVARVIAGVLNNGADISVPTVGGTMARVEDINNKITNCITEIPQDVTVSLSDGTVTLAQGSKSYKADGTTITASTNVTKTYTTNGSWFLVLENSNYISQINANSITASNTEPVSPSNNDGWWDTVNNKLYKYSGAWVEEPLPFALVTVSGGAISSIDHVFNGIGYIGSTVFTLPGIKALMPDGKNADGTYKNIVINQTNVLTKSATYAADNLDVLFTNSGTVVIGSGIQYDIATNTMLSGGGTLKRCSIARITTTTGGQITSFSPKYVLQALDYNNGEYIAHCAMPSNRKIDLTASLTDGYVFNAPADGYVYLGKYSTASGQRIRLQNTSSNMAVSCWSSGVQNLECIIAVSKGQNVKAVYSADGSTNGFFFVYSNGAK